MSAMKQFLDSTPAFADTAELVVRLARDGYLFLRGVVPGDVIAALQAEVGAIARDAGWLAADHPVAEAKADQRGFCVDPDPRYLTTLRRINKLERYHALKHHSALMTLIERLLGGAVFPHPRVLMRNIFPARTAYTTKAHQDFPNVQGTTEVLTCWIPLVDCPLEVGPLQIAAGSHRGGVYDFDIGAGAGGIEITERFENSWVSGPFARGDVLIFHAMTVHKGVPNHSDKLRMSMDVRYQRVDAPFNFENAQPDGQPLTWDEVYAGWQSDALKHYWTKLPLQAKSFDRIWFDKRDALGFALGEKRDPRARSVLQRIVARDNDPEKRARAQTLLDALPAD
jgi:ectoine hydroxylase-related dioxygenase (phytanoyl-CoA dioxygenase family)